MACRDLSYLAELSGPAVRGWAATLAATIWEMVLWRARKDCAAARQAGNRRKTAEQAEAKSAASTGALHRKRTAAEAAEAKSAASTSGALQRKRMAAVLKASGGGSAAAAAAAGAAGGGRGTGGSGVRGAHGAGGGAAAGTGAGVGASKTPGGIGHGVTMRSIRAKFLKDMAPVRGFTVKFRVGNASGWRVW